MTLLPPPTALELPRWQLKPCPFCGNKKPKIVGPDTHTNIFVLCYKCGARGCIVNAGHGGSTDEAVEAWNTRPASAITSLEARLAQVERERDYAFKTLRDNFGRTLVEANHNLELRVEEATARVTALETALREAEEALSLAADVVADMFRTGAAHTDLGPDAPPAFGYYIGVGVQPTIVRARDAARAHLTHGLGPWVR